MNRRGNHQQRPRVVVYVVAGEDLSLVAGGGGGQAALGPLAGPDPLPRPAAPALPPPEPHPGEQATYQPNRRREQPGAPPGFFLDRYIY